MARQLRAEQTRATILGAAADPVRPPRLRVDQPERDRGPRRSHQGRPVLPLRGEGGPRPRHHGAPVQNLAPTRRGAGRPGLHLPGGADAPHVRHGQAVRGGAGPAGRAAARHRGRAGAAAAAAPLHRVAEIASSRLVDAVRQSDLHPDIDVDSSPTPSSAPSSAPASWAAPLEPAARQPRRLAGMWHLLIRGMVPVTRRARYLTLAARLEREMGGI